MIVNYLNHKRLPKLANYLQCFLISAGLVVCLFYIEGNIDINLADEGFLWYGTIHTALGRVIN